MDELIKWKKYLLKNKKLNAKFGIYSRLYKMTTENILEFVNKNDFENKRVLTVTGSGDHALNSILKGARNITCFDVNPFSYYQLKLKKAAIKNLSYDEFLKFFNIVNSTDESYSFLDKDIFNSLKTHLDNETIFMFDTLYDIFLNSKDIMKNIYYSFCTNLDHMKEMCNYLNKEEYIKLSKIMNNEKININFIQSDFVNLKDNINDQKYDIILLSNISDYIEFMYKNNPLENYYNDTMQLTDNLTDFGILQLGYIYRHIDCIRINNTFADKELRQKYFDSNIFKTTYVQAFEDDFCQYTDQIVTYQKRI